MLWQWVNTAEQVYILDLDGTMMPTAEVDNQCFWQAVFDCFGDRCELPKLHGFKHVTDTGILQEWCSVELGRVPEEAEIRHIKQRFLQLLEQAATRQPRDFKALPGVKDWLAAVEQHPRVTAAIATGGWAHSARMKLRHAGLDRFDLPLASSDDAISRTGIMRVAADMVEQRSSTGTARMVYVGDGPWDLEASKQLGWSFIGIAEGPGAEQLTQAGASVVYPDFKRPVFQNCRG